LTTIPASDGPAFVAEFTLYGSEVSDQSAAKLRAELGRIAYSDIGRALKWGMAESRGEGKPDIQYVTLKESGELDEDTRRAISAAFADRRRAQIANAA